MSRLSKPIYLGMPDDYQERIELAKNAAVLALNDRTPKTATDPTYQDLKDAYDKLKAEAESAADEAGLMVVFDILGRQTMRKLKERHPLRPDHSEDQMFGANMESMQDDLVHLMLVKPTSAACAKDQPRAEEPCGPENPCSRRRAFADWADGIGYGEWNYTNVSAVEHLVDVANAPKDLPSSPTPSDD